MVVVLDNTTTTRFSRATLAQRHVLTTTHSNAPHARQTRNALLLSMCGRSQNADSVGYAWRQICVCVWRTSNYKTGCVFYRRNHLSGRNLHVGRGPRCWEMLRGVGHILSVLYSMQFYSMRNYFQIFKTRVMQPRCGQSQNLLMCLYLPRTMYECDIGLEINTRETPMYGRQVKLKANNEQQPDTSASRISQR